MDPAVKSLTKTGNTFILHLVCKYHAANITVDILSLERICFSCFRSVLKIWAKKGKNFEFCGESCLLSQCVCLISPLPKIISRVLMTTALYLAPALNFSSPGVIFSAFSAVTLHPTCCAPLFTQFPHRTYFPCSLLSKSLPSVKTCLDSPLLQENCVPQFSSKTTTGKSGTVLGSWPSLSFCRRCQQCTVVVKSNYWRSLHTICVTLSRAVNLCEPLCMYLKS